MHKLACRYFVKPFMRFCLAHSTKKNNFICHKTSLHLVPAKNIRGCLRLLPGTFSSVSCWSTFASSNNLESSFTKSFHSLSYLNEDHDDGKLNGSSKGLDKNVPRKHIKSTKKKERKKIDFTKTFTERNFITPIRAMNEYLLKPIDLEGLRKIQRRSPIDGNPPISVYLRKEVEQKAIEVWGSREALERELKKRYADEQSLRDSIFHVKKLLKEYTYSKIQKEELKHKEMILKTSGSVVMSAVIINAINFAFKLTAWLFTGSHSMFAEAIHSLADTGNQCLLAYGIKKSLQTPTEYHPYGYHSMRFVASLVSGVGIFFLGTGLSFYHGVMGILHPEPMESLYWAYLVLGGSLILESATLAIAFRETQRGAKRDGMTFSQYVLRSQDPSVNVVLLEDIAAILGAAIAAGCIGLTSYTGLPIYDAIGSIAVGGILGTVASFIIFTNTAALVGKSIPRERLEEINQELENDIMIRAVHDVKATDMGNKYVRFKAELDFDGRQLSKSYLDSQDLDALLQEMQGLKTIDEVEIFMLKHGENIVDLLGGEIDRIEIALKKKHPEMKHVDLEVL